LVENGYFLYYFTLLWQCMLLSVPTFSNIFCIVPQKRAYCESTSPYNRRYLSWRVTNQVMKNSSSFSVRGKQHHSPAPCLEMFTSWNGLKMDRGIVVGIVTRYWLRIGSRYRREFSHPSRWHWGPHSITYRAIPVAKMAGRDVNHPASRSVEVTEILELYCYSPSVPPWMVTGRT